MKLTQLSIASDMLKRIKVLDEQIIKLEQLAMQAANDEVQCVMKLDIENCTLQQETKEDILDEDGSLQLNASIDRGWLRFRRQYFTVIDDINDRDKKNENESLNETLNNSCALMIIGVLLGEKQRERERLLKSLQRMGVHI